MTDTPILVQKFGGTSVATPERRQQVVEHIRRAREAGYRVAIVVSAMGRRGDPYATDSLLDLLRLDGGAVAPRDYDLVFVSGEIISAAVMSQTLKRAGIPAVGLTGGQAGLHTDGHYREAEIVEIDVARLRRHMAAGEVPVIAGGQGIDPGSLDYTTLGRGASDTSGVAFGVALGAEKVEIFTDVEGVAATDPRTVPMAHWLARVSFPAMYELARFGAKVLHPRAILAGWRAQTPIVVRSTFSTAPGTVIGDVADQWPIVGIATLSPMETVWLPADGVDDETRVRWERRLVIMSAVDAASGRLMAGIQATRRDELDQALTEAGVAPTGRFLNAAWISLVGDADAVADRAARDRECLAQEGIALTGFEYAGGRATYVVSASDLQRAVTALYRDVFAVAG
jgi:aspartate kinase